MDVFEIDILAMGTSLSIKVWGKLDDGEKENIKEKIESYTTWFDNTFSRFKEESLMSEISKGAGTYKVPRELVEMLEIYKTFEKTTSGAMNPFMGNTFEDLGYDKNYTLKKKEKINLPKKIDEVLEIIDNENIKLNEEVLIDIGALGKGFWVDKIKEMLEEKNIEKFLVNGSGDIYYKSSDESIVVGLENPFDVTQAIGKINIKNQSICGSGINKRKWGTDLEEINHVVNARTGEIAKNIVSTWVIADTATIADAICTALFFVKPDELKKGLASPFEYLVVFADSTFAKSDGFNAEL